MNNCVILKTQDIEKGDKMEVFSLVGKIAIDYTDASRKLEKLSNTADDTAENLNDVSDAAEDSQGAVRGSGEAASDADNSFSTWRMTLANLASKAIVGMIQKVEELGQKIGELVSNSVSNFAEYEQLVGGVETLFKDSSDTLIGYAENAYRTAGMSSNQYMETATSFAASLIQGLGGDTEAAVRLTDMAITDMSDNANKMGTDIASIQAAYQGFAKQNYTMLDNLKLGYGGTQAEMVRLINDSGILQEKIEDLDGITFDQMIEAIHVVQDNLGITGTTAAEAGSTISGSWGSVQALFENIKTKVGGELAPVVMGFLQQLSGWMEGVDWDAFAEKIGASFGSLLDWISQIDFASFFDAGITGIINFVENLGGLIDKVIAVIDGFGGFMDIINALLPVIVGVTTAVMAFSTALKITEIIKGVSTGLTALWAVINANPIMLIVSLIAGLVAAVITLWNTNEDFRNGVINLWNNIKSFFTNTVNAIKNTAVTVWNAIKTAIVTPIEAAKNTITTLLNGIKTTFSTVFNGIKSFLSPVVEWLKGIFNFQWNLPHIKLPHFSISGSFSLNPPSIPHFSVEWYKKAMQDGMILDEPTIFGFNPKTGNLLGGGEAGSEAIVGVSSLQDMIDESVSRNTGNLLEVLAYNVSALVDLAAKYYPEISEKVDRPIVLDGVEVSRGLGEYMDDELGNLYNYRKRGVLA